ncbi:MAG: hypothetical protein JNK73_01995 [Bacteroidia bacterium]|nr:hypothetical protein [Bacteroidia bacterium]
MKAKLILGIVLFACNQAYSQNQLLSTGPVFAGGLGILNTGNNIHQLNVYSTTGAGQIGMGGTAPAISFYGGNLVPLGVPAAFSQPYTKIGLATGVNHFINGATSGDFVIQNVTQSKSILFSSYFSNGNGIEHMRLTSAGQLLLGATSSLSKLHVESSNLLPGVTISNPIGYALSVSDLNGGNFAIWPNGNLIIGNTNVIQNSKVHIESTGSAGLNINDATGYALAVHESGGGKFAVWPNGKVTIGNTSNSSLANLRINASGGNALEVFDGTLNFKLMSNGFVFCKELQVVTQIYPDYVFSKDYKLLPLEEVEKFIVQNNRLPGFENADYYIENGIKTSEMFVKQQEKIEELTLYIIELEKRLQKLENLK